MNLHLIWDMDGTLVNSEPEILKTIDKALGQLGLSVNDATSPLRVGPPLPTMLRSAFTEQQLNDEQISDVIAHFRTIYDASEFHETIPFPGIDELIRENRYVHHVITNKPNYATKRIIDKKGWDDYIVEVLSPDTLFSEVGRNMLKPELFKTFRSMYPYVSLVGIGDMAKDAECAREVGIPAIGVLWGTGTKGELEEAGCNDIVATAEELRVALNKYK